MKVVGIQIESNEAILVVLEKLENGSIVQTDDSICFDIEDHSISKQIQQFRDQVNTTFNSISPSKIGMRARNAKAKATGKVRAPSPLSFKLEGIIQLYEKVDIEFVWPQSITSYKKKNEIRLIAKNKYQQDALDVAYYLIDKYYGAK